MMEPDRSPIVKVRGLRKTYSVRERRSLFGGKVREINALRGVDLDIFPGEIFGLLGPNGAGKTTLIKCLTTLLLPTAGQMEVCGLDPVRQEDAVRASIGCMLMGERGLYWKLTGRENLEFFGAMQYLPGPERRRRANEIITWLHLGEIIDRAVETYSSGQKMKLAFARSLMHPAPLLILDEPTNTLDVPSARELRAAVRELNRQGRTIIYTTHQMVEVEDLCDRAAIIDRGVVIASGTVPELKASLHRESVIRVEGMLPDSALEVVRALPGVREVVLSSAPSGQAQEMRVVAECPRELLPELIRVLYEGGAQIQEISPVQQTLEDVFVALTGRSLAEDTGLAPVK